MFDRRTIHITPNTTAAERNQQKNVSVLIWHFINVGINDSVVFVFVSACIIRWWNEDGYDRTAMMMNSNKVEDL